MRLATVRYEGQTHAARVADDHVDVLEAADVGALLAAPGGVKTAGRVGDSAGAQRCRFYGDPRTATVEGDVRRPELPQAHPGNRFGYSGVPNGFAKYTRALIGDGDEIMLPPISTKVDWEVELVVVIGREVRNAEAAEAANAIGGFSVGNDISARDLQSRTSQWLQGKSCEATSPVGPCMTTTDVTGVEPDLAISCAVDGVTRRVPGPQTSCSNLWSWSRT